MPAYRDNSISPARCFEQTAGGYTIKRPSCGRLLTEIANRLPALTPIARSAIPLEELS